MWAGSFSLRKLRSSAAVGRDLPIPFIKLGDQQRLDPTVPSQREHAQVEPGVRLRLTKQQRLRVGGERMAKLQIGALRQAIDRPGASVPLSEGYPVNNVLRIDI